MNIIKLLPFGGYMYHILIKIRPHQMRIRKYRREGLLEEEKATIRQAENQWADWVLSHAGVTVHVSGEENIPQNGPVVIASNHQGYGDIPILIKTFSSMQVGFVAKDDLEKIPAYGGWIRDIRSVFIKRDDARASLRAIDEAIGYINEGFSMAIFPEGTRSRGAAMGEFKKGTLKLASKPMVPVVPVTINGSYHAFEEKGYPQPADVYVHVHPQIETAELTRPEANALPGKVEEIIKEKLNEMTKQD